MLHLAFTECPPEYAHINGFTQYPPMAAQDGIGVGVGCTHEQKYALPPALTNLQ